MKKLILISLFALVLFSCKKKEDEVAPIVPTYSLTVNINDTGSIIDENKQYNIALYKSQEDFDNRFNAAPMITGITTDNSNSHTFKNLENRTIYIFIGNTFGSDILNNPIIIKLDSDKTVTGDLAN